MNFENFEDGEATERPPNIFPLTRQSSVYSLTFDEFQSTVGGSIGRDFGSMNMDELLKNIWTTEETQHISGPSGNPCNYLQSQGSLTLPRTLSQKTVDEVWKDLSGEKTDFPLRQPTLGEVTLEEFLLRAGVVREETKFPEKPHNFDLLGDLTRRPVSDQPLGFGFQNANGIIVNNNNRSELRADNIQVPLNGTRQQLILPKQAQLSYANQIPIQGLNGNLVHNGGQGMIGNGVTVATESAALSYDGIGRTNGDNSYVSPIPYVFTGGLRGRRSSNKVEKVIERRHRRMIKNRESAARSRARKQAYTTELETELAKLKEENQELLKKQAELRKMQKKQVFEMMNMPRGGKRKRLKRTRTGPW